MIQTNPIFQQNNPFLPQSYQISQPSAQSLASILLTDGLLQNSLNRGGLSLKKTPIENVKLVFDQGMDKLRSVKTLYKYVKKIRNPFNAQGEVRIKQNQIKQQLKTRKIPCRRLVKVRSKTNKAKQICREIRRRRLAARRKVKKKLKTRKKKP